MEEKNKRIPVSPKDLFKAFKSLFDESPEQFVIIWFGGNNKIIDFHIAASSPTENILKGAMAPIATGAAVLQGRSRNSEISKEDIDFAKKLSHYGKEIGLELYDYIIITGDNFTSFAERRLL